MAKSVSYSQLRTWLKCPRHHKRLYITDEKQFPVNEYILLGRAVHETCEQLAKCYPNLPKTPPLLYSHLAEQNQEKSVDTDIVKFGEAYFDIIPEAFPFLESQFYDFSVKAVEKKINIKLNDYLSIQMSQDYWFNGYVDLILQEEHGKTILIDWKTSTKGWNKWKRQDEKYYYQMILYKYFYHKKFQIPLENLIPAFIVFDESSRDIDSFYPPNEWSDALESLEWMIHNAYEEGYHPLKKTCYFDFCECKDLR